MVSILIVSHSALLSAGVQEFVSQVAGPEVRIAAVGGAPDGGLGTSVEQIRAALSSIATAEGVLVLVDLKGAVIAVDAALEELDDLRVVVSNAPLVEGAYLAAIEASVGATLDETATAALRACDILKVHCPS